MDDEVEVEPSVCIEVVELAMDVELTGRLLQSSTPLFVALLKENEAKMVYLSFPEVYPVFLAYDRSQN